MSDGIARLIIENIRLKKKAAMHQMKYDNSVCDCKQEPVAWIPAFTQPEDGRYWGISSSGAEGKCCFEDGEWHHMADGNYCQFYRPLTKENEG